MENENENKREKVGISHKQDQMEQSVHQYP